MLSTSDRARRAPQPLGVLLGLQTARTPIEQAIYEALTPVGRYVHPAREHADRPALVRSYEAWAQRCYRIRDKHGATRPLVLNEAQRIVGAAEAAMLGERGMARLMVLKGRQGGISTDQQGRALHQVWAQPGFDALTLAHTTGDTDKLFEITRRALDHFPLDLLGPVGDRTTNEVSFPDLDTSFFTGTAGSRRVGRGLTLKRVHGSEFAFWEDPIGVLGSVTPALVPHGSVVVLETTASGHGSPAHQFWQECAARGYRAVFIPWWLCDRENYRLPLEAPDELGALDPEEAPLVERHGLDLEQLKWRRAKMAELGRDLFLQEYAEDPDSCWLAVGGLFYDAGKLKALATRAPAPVETLMGGTLTLYVPEATLRTKRRVILGGDVAEGADGDASTFVARTLAGELLATFRDPRIEPNDYADLLNTWGRRLGGADGPAFLVIEKNAHGITVLRRLRDVHKYPSSRIYHRRVADTETHERQDRIGWYTSAETKPLLLDGGRELIAAALAGGDFGPPCAGVVQDLFAIRRDEDGRVSLNGRDLLVAELLAWQGRGAMPAVPNLPPLHF